MEQRNQTVMKLAQTAIPCRSVLRVIYLSSDKDPHAGRRCHLPSYRKCLLCAGSPLLGGWYGGLAGAIGMGIADIMDPIYITGAPKTFLLKLCIGLNHRAGRSQDRQINESSDKAYVAKWSTIAAVAGLGFNVVADPVVGYFYKMYILGQPPADGGSAGKVEHGGNLCECDRLHGPCVLPVQCGAACPPSQAVFCPARTDTPVPWLSSLL